MDIKEELELGYSKSQAVKIATYIELHPEKLQELMKCFFSKNNRLCQRAAWPIGKLGVKKPEMIAPYLEKMILNLDEPRHDAIIRNTINILQHLEIPRHLMGEVYERCFKYLISPDIPVAIRVFSMTVLSNIAHHFPELVPELILAIEEHYLYGSAGFQSRARKELKRLNKIIIN